MDNGIYEAYSNKLLEIGLLQHCAMKVSQGQIDVSQDRFVQLRLVEAAAYKTACDNPVRKGDSVAEDA